VAPSLPTHGHPARHSSAALSPTDAAAEPLAGEADQGNPADPGFGVFDAREDAIWADAIAPLDQHVFDSTTARGIAAAVIGGDLAEVSMELAKSAGMDPALAAEYVGAGAEMHQRTADRELGKLGLSGDDLQSAYAWMRESKGTALRHCVQQFVMGRDVGPLRKLASEYMIEQKRRTG